MVMLQTTRQDQAPTSRSDWWGLENKPVRCASPLVILVTESDVVSFIGVFLSILIELSKS